MVGHDLQEILGIGVKGLGVGVKQGCGSVLVIFWGEDITMRVSCLGVESASKLLGG
jgi:hypothetical protein